MQNLEMLEPSLDSLNGPGHYIFSLVQSSYPIFSMVWECIDDIQHTHVTEHVLSMNENDSSDHCFRTGFVEKSHKYRLCIICRLSNFYFHSRQYLIQFLECPV